MFDLPPLPPLELTEHLQFILDLGGVVAAAVIGGAIAVRLRQPADRSATCWPASPSGRSRRGSWATSTEIAVLADIGVVLLLFALGVQFSIRELRAVGRVALPGGDGPGPADPGGRRGGDGRARVGPARGAGRRRLPVDLLDARRPQVTARPWRDRQPPRAGRDRLVDRPGHRHDRLHRRPAAARRGRRRRAVRAGHRARRRCSSRSPTSSARGSCRGRSGRSRGWARASCSCWRSFATALLTAFIASAVFGLSLALGAFVAGVLISESELSHQAAAEVTPFRDLFAVLFFVSVGMLVDPDGAARRTSDSSPCSWSSPSVGKGIADRGPGARLRVAAAVRGHARGAMAQVGEFSFILADDALDLDLLYGRIYNLVLGTAVVSILLSPFVAQLVAMPRPAGSSASGGERDGGSGEARPRGRPVAPAERRRDRRAVADRARARPG